MAKKKKSNVNLDLNDLLGTMDASISEVNVNHLFDPEEARIEDSVSSGSRLIDRVTGSVTNPGILFTGRFTELIGVEGAGKTTLLMQTCAQAQNMGRNVVFFDTEKKAFSVDHMERLGIDFGARGSNGEDGKKGFFKIVKCSTMKDIDDHLTKMVESGIAEHIDVIIIDSVATALTTKQIELGIEDSRQIGQHAYGIQKLFGKLRFYKDEYRWAVASVNQLRRNPGSAMGGAFQAKAVNQKGLGGSNDDSWGKTGGRAYAHDLHNVVFLDTMKMEKNEDGEIIKQYIRITTHKNMVGPVGRRVMVKLVQNKGFSDEETLIETMQEWGYISHSSGGNYDVFDSHDESKAPALKVKGAENLLSAIKGQKGLLDKMYELYFDLVEQNMGSSSEDEDDDEEIEVD